MRHGKKFNHLSRNASHRNALLRNLSKSLILKKRIVTTVAKAKALRKFIEPILTKSKNDTTHSRRIVFSYFQDKIPVKELFNNISNKISDRPGGYTRIIKLSEKRLGDNSEMCIIELVDYNELTTKKVKAKSKTRRGRTKSMKSETHQQATNINSSKQIKTKSPEVQPKTQNKEESKEKLKIEEPSKIEHTKKTELKESKEKLESKEINEVKEDKKELEQKLTSQESKENLESKEVKEDKKELEQKLASQESKENLESKEVKENKKELEQKSPNSESKENKEEKGKTEE